MQYQHEYEESFENLDDYLKYKRRLDLDKVEAYVRQQEQQQLESNKTDLPSSDNDLFEIGGLDDDDPYDLLEQTRLERAKYLIANRELFENDLSVDLDIDPDISCPVLTNEERIEKLAALTLSKKNVEETTSEAATGTKSIDVTTPLLDMFDKTECEEVNEILKSREVNKTTKNDV